jgi:two-component system chemotaxis response regulator CheB
VHSPDPVPPGSDSPRDAALDERVVVAGASAGGLEPLVSLVRGLPVDFPAAVCIVLHTPPHSPGRIAQVLARSCRLPVGNAVDDEPLRPGHVYVAPPDRHLVLELGRVRLTHGPRENRQRPAVDALFRSAAFVYGARAVGIVLSGALDDGTAGLWAIKDRGGVVIVQDPDEALFPWMPQSAMQHVSVDHVVTAAELAPLLLGLVSAPTPASEDTPVSRELEIVNQIAKGDSAMDAGVMELGPTTPYTCPDCSGVLMRVAEGGVAAYRCHTGHAFSFDTLLATTTEHTDEMLWNALRSTEEVMLLLQQAARSARERHDLSAVEAAERRVAEVSQRADLLREVVKQHRALATVPLGAQTRSRPGALPPSHGGAARS